MVIKKIILSFIIAIFILSFTSAWSTNTFNNSLTSENITFTGNQNYTKYLSIPSSVNLITSAYLNLSGYWRNISRTYKNISDSFSCVNYNWGIAPYCNASDDNSFSTYAVNPGGAPTDTLIYENTSLIGYNFTSVNWTSKGYYWRAAGVLYSYTQVDYYNYTSSDWQLLFYGNCLKTHGDFTSTGNTCYIEIPNDGLVTKQLSIRTTMVKDGALESRYYEGITIINSTSSIISDINLKVSNDNIYNYTGEFNQRNNRTSNIASTINKYLNSTYLVGGFYNIPFIFSSATSGVLEYLDMLFNNEGVLINSVSYNSTTYETAREGFLINYSRDSSVLSSQAYLFYNNTPYLATTSCSGTQCISYKNIDIPLLPNGINSRNYSFYWNITIYDGTNSYSSLSNIYNQTVNQLTLSKCSSGVIALNYTLYDEQNRTRITPFTFDGSFYYSSGSATTYKNVNITNSTADEITLCIDNNVTYYIDAIIAYSAPNSATTYTIRNYFYQKYAINNITQNVPLYLLKSSSSTSFILKVIDEHSLPVPSVLINAQKCFPGVNTNETVFISRTDNNGLTVGNFEAENALYQFFITNQSNTLLTVTPCSKVVPQETPYTLTFQLGGGYISPFSNIKNVSGITESLIFNKTSNVVTLTYIDTSGDFSYAELVIKRSNFSGNTQSTICSANNSLSSGIITCNVTSGGSYFAVAYIHRTNQILIDQISFSVETISSTLGYYGVFLGFFIILICSFIFKFNEIAGIVMVNIGCIFCNTIGLINFGWGSITAIIVVSIVIIVILER